MRIHKNINKSMQRMKGAESITERQISKKNDSVPRMSTLPHHIMKQSKICKYANLDGIESATYVVTER